MWHSCTIFSHALLYSTFWSASIKILINFSHKKLLNSLSDTFHQSEMFSDTAISRKVDGKKDMRQSRKVHYWPQCGCGTCFCCFLVFWCSKTHVKGDLSGVSCHFLTFSWNALKVKEQSDKNPQYLPESVACIFYRQPFSKRLYTEQFLLYLNDAASVTF